MRCCSATSLTGETGTYVYMAPEMIRHELYTSKADVFSWGVLLAEVLCQRPPYEGLYMTPVQVPFPPSLSFLSIASTIAPHPFLLSLSQKLTAVAVLLVKLHLKCFIQHQVAPNPPQNKAQDQVGTHCKAGCRWHWLSGITSCGRHCRQTHQRRC